MLGGVGADFEDACVPEGWWGGGVGGAMEGDIGVEVEGGGLWGEGGRV